MFRIVVFAARFLHAHSHLNGSVVLVSAMSGLGFPAFIFTRLQCVSALFARRQ
jgi:hypothetical protein